ncbi:hypothetical protein NPIL_684541 [Nephila pilipes]|uniref:Uncharacterized protein n=1 Tax=Nephila pilipes TaxID=299642 RepID=A0A8X6MCZ7_NEPPI|nr:hypothetical protein NPIL_345261 [Nephila pilipes]GFS46959.1 hypothetical protein NPIL_684541 [Nephila pilipes]
MKFGLSFRVPYRPACKRRYLKGLNGAPRKFNADERLRRNNIILYALHSCLGHRRRFKLDHTPKGIVTQDGSRGGRVYPNLTTVFWRSELNK